MRGEHWKLVSTNGPVQGSSPHARGARDPAGTDLHARGIIPACAGSTVRRRVRRSRGRDHPRMRGEHCQWFAGTSEGPGSSPHARGARPCPTSPTTSGTDHPRMRGEHRSDVTYSRALAGSSPHARGARDHERAGLADVGIIPACAGSTLPDQPFCRARGRSSFTFVTIHFVPRRFRPVGARGAPPSGTCSRCSSRVAAVGARTTGRPAAASTARRRSRWAASRGDGP